MKSSIVAATVTLALAGVARAGPTIVSMTYGDLSGNYTATSATTGTFNAHAVDIAGLLRSSGDVSRLEGPLGTADFQPGFVSGADLADFVMNLTVNHNASTGTGAGSFTATDADGDTITGNLNGFWRLQGTFITFEGTLSNVIIHDNGTLDHTFNGSNTGSWDTNGFSNPGPYNGAIVKLTENAGNFFTSDFSNMATGLTAQITAPITVPLPTGSTAGGSVVAGLAALRVLRRRR